MPAVRGFTLVEMLVTVALVGILTGALVLASGAGGGGYAVDAEARRLAQLVRLVADEAAAANHEYAIRFERDGYRVLRLDASASPQWQELDDWPRYRLPGGMHLEAGLDDQPGAAAAVAAGAPTQPQLLILSSGEWTPFSVALQSRSHRRRVHSDGIAGPLVELEGAP